MFVSRLFNRTQDKVQGKQDSHSGPIAQRSSTTTSALFWAIGLIASGALLLIWTLGLLTAYEPWAQISMAVLLVIVGAGFFGGFFAARINGVRAGWWRFIPAWTMIALAVMVLLSTLDPAPVELIAALLFWGLAAAFLHIYLLQRSEHWWALIPGGFMLVLGGVILLSTFTINIAILGALLFAGMGGVFFALYALSGSARQWWSLIPGSVLVIFGLFILISEVEGNAQLMRWWPLLIVLIGVSILWRIAGSGRQPLITPTPAVTNSANTTETANATAASLTHRLGDYSQPAPGASVEILPDGEQP